jgi:RND family efflux transporter MFP subunit
MLTACQERTVSAQKKDPPPAKVANQGAKEADLATITLTEEAERRLGIQLSAAEDRSGSRTGTWAGELVVPPDKTLVVSAPVAGTVALASGTLPSPGARLQRGSVLLHITPLLPPERDLHATLEAEVAAAQTRVDAAKLRFERADRLLREQVGSVKAKEVAQEELSLAQTALAAARAKLDRLRQSPLNADVRVAVAVPENGILKRTHVAAGQIVAAGAPLFEVEQLETLWIRVPIYAGEMAAVVQGTPGTVRPLNADASAPARQATPVSAPPSADPLAATVDLYFQLSNADLSLQPGRKVSVTLPLRGDIRGLMIPWGAVVFDIHGGTWVYENVAPHKYARRRVEVARVAEGAAQVKRGLSAGAKVVIRGAAELWGTEFGAGK